MTAGSASYGMTDTMGCMHSDAQFKTNKKSLPKLESSFFIHLITIIFPS